MEIGDKVKYKDEIHLTGTGQKTIFTILGKDEKGLILSLREYPDFPQDYYTQENKVVQVYNNGRIIKKELLKDKE